ncbi:MAG TPA: SIMPL domain-containing protein, partial [Candidatus Cloacimonadota bacterium]|nr:SIMPL domain-containing protein [Candidatus Cloacimonadota bacterium]
MKHFYLVIVALIIATGLCAEETKPVVLFPDHHLCLEASGKVVVEADQAEFSFDTKGYGATLRAAVKKAKDSVADICGELTAIGIDPKSFATGSFASGKNSSSFFLTDKKDYCATLVTSVTLRDMSKLDEAILILTDKKAENLSGIHFSLADMSEARQQAREIALNRIVEQRETIC